MDEHGNKEMAERGAGSIATKRWLREVLAAGQLVGGRPSRSEGLSGQVGLKVYLKLQKS